ncbi:Biopolymer transport protein (plasmid) [Marinovum algicola DG 898]|nr:Biopolymer transport protein [Marinovum algicola DG 898]
MTSLIDVIFLLLLFFMLSSTFTRFAEIDLATGGTGSVPDDTRPLFLRLSPVALSLNGRPQDLSTLPGLLRDNQPEAAAELPVLVALDGAVTAQRLTDLLAVLRRVPGVRVTVLGAS